MKTAITLALVCLAAVLAAQFALAVTPHAPRVINYQGRLTDGAGNPVSDGPHSAHFIIWRDSTSTNPGDIVWDSGPLTVTTDKGIFSVRLGTPPQPVLDPANMQDTIRYLGIAVGADPEITPRTRLTSVPYAYIAEHANTALSAGTAYALDPAVAPAAGTAYFSLTSTTSTSLTTMGHFNVIAPGPGYLTINVSGFVYLNADATTSGSITPSFILGLCDTPNSLACGSSYATIYVSDPDSVSSNNQTPAFSFNRTIQVFSAGSYTYYINGATSNIAYSLNGWGEAMASVIFTPNSLTLTTFPAPPQTTDDQNARLQQQQERR